MSRSLLVALAAAAALSGCASSSPKTAANSQCVGPFAEPLDPRSGQHLLPGAAEPPYTTNPPTSGAHRPGTYPTGVLVNELSKPVQVAMLESGGVLIQYRDVSAATRAAVERLATGRADVTVAPNPTLATKIVATAWIFKLTCERVDAKLIADFITAYAGKNQAHQ